MAAAVHSHASALRRRGGEASVFACPPLPVGVTFFSSKIEAVSVGASARIVSALSRHLDGQTRMLLEDPRRSSWRDSLAALGAALGGDSLRADESPIAEVLNVAWGVHEATAEHVDDALAFLEAHMPPPTGEQWRAVSSARECVGVT